MRTVGNAVMVLAKPPSWRSSPKRRVRRTGYRLVILAVVLCLGACNPVDTWRDWTGASKNDPDPETTPNTRNLAAGDASDYPNLATVDMATRKSLLPTVREMPIWPAAGSVRVADGIVLVRLGQKPGYIHMRAKNLAAP